jgi:hypothetical protein
MVKRSLLLLLALASTGCGNSSPASDGGVDATADGATDVDVKPDGYVPGCEVNICGQTVYVLENVTTTVDSCGDQCTCTVQGDVDGSGGLVTFTCGPNCPCDGGK